MSKILLFALLSYLSLVLAVSQATIVSGGLVYTRDAETLTKTTLGTTDSTTVASDLTEGSHIAVLGTLTPLILELAPSDGTWTIRTVGGGTTATTHDGEYIDHAVAADNLYVLHQVGDIYTVVSVNPTTLATTLAFTCPECVPGSTLHAGVVGGGGWVAAVTGSDTSTEFTFGAGAGDKYVMEGKYSVTGYDGVFVLTSTTERLTVFVEKEGEGQVKFVRGPADTYEVGAVGRGTDHHPVLMFNAGADKTIVAEYKTGSEVSYTLMESGVASNVMHFHDSSFWLFDPTSTTQPTKVTLAPPTVTFTPANDQNLLNIPYINNAGVLALAASAPAGTSYSPSTHRFSFCLAPKYGGNCQHERTSPLTYYTSFVYNQKWPFGAVSVAPVTAGFVASDRGELIKCQNREYSTGQETSCLLCSTKSILKTDTDTGANIDCNPCPAGHQCVNDTPTPCPAGTYGEDGTCKTCNGYITLSSTDLPVKCTPCPANSEPTSPASTTCKTKNGYYQRANGTIVACEPGYACKDGTRTKCTESTYTDKFGEIECRNCGLTVNTSNTLCQGPLCGPGFGIGDDGTCQPCSAGTYAPTAAPAPCQPTPANHYPTDSTGELAADGAVGVRPCPAGTVGDDQGAYCVLDDGFELVNSKLTVFDDGNIRATKPVNCKEIDETGSQCLTCPTNYILVTSTLKPATTGTAGHSCLPCPNNTTAKDNTCHLAPGYYLSTIDPAGVSSYQLVTQCPAGSACPGGSAGWLQPCWAHERQYQPNQAQESCLTCPANMIIVTENGQGLTRKACPDGYACNGTAKKTACAAGTYSNNGKCQPCPTGTYSGFSGAATCTPCTGTNNSNSGGTACLLCPADQYMDTDDKCKPVSGSHKMVSPDGRSEVTRGGYCGEAKCAGMQVYAVGDLTYTTCTSPWVPNHNRTACVRCPEGSLVNEADGTCKSCPQGVEDGRCAMPAGFYEVNGVITACPDGKACMKGNNTPIDCSLEKGLYSYKGLVCVTCLAGNYLTPDSTGKLGFQCHPCPEGHRCPGLSAKPVPCVDENAFQPAAGAAACVPCRFTPSKDGTKCGCEAGAVVSADGDTCVPCASGVQLEDSYTGLYCHSCGYGQVESNGGCKSIRVTAYATSGAVSVVLIITVTLISYFAISKKRARGSSSKATVPPETPQVAVRAPRAAPQGRRQPPSRLATTVLADN